MTEGAAVAVRPGRRAELLAGVAFLLGAAVLLWWAKWAPYSVKVPAVAGSGDLGDSILTGGAEAPPGASLSAGLTFAGTYFLAIWPALVTGLVIAAAVQVLVPRGWLQRALGAEDGSSRKLGAGPGAGGGLRGGLLSLPTLMCSCCAAPVALGLRRARVGVPAALAFWLGNPALNPVVLVFAAFVLPWPWVLLRGAMGVLVVAAALLVARRWADRSAPADVADASGPQVAEPPSLTGFLRTLGGLSLRLLPEYALVVVALGALRGPLFGQEVSGLLGPLVVLVVALAGLLLPVPTGGEIAVVAALLAAGAGGAAAGALLITLPVVSLPSLLMVRKAFPVPVLVRVCGVVLGAGLLAAALAVPL